MGRRDRGAGLREILGSSPPVQAKPSTTTDRLRLTREGLELREIQERRERSVGAPVVDPHSSGAEWYAQTLARLEWQIGEAQRDRQWAACATLQARVEAIRGRAQEEAPRGLLSLPADERLRRLRAEARYWPVEVLTIAAEEIERRANVVDA